MEVKVFTALRRYKPTEHNADDLAFMKRMLRASAMNWLGNEEEANPHCYCIFQILFSEKEDLEDFSIPRTRLIKITLRYKLYPLSKEQQGKEIAFS